MKTITCLLTTLLAYFICNAQVSFKSPWPTGEVLNAVCISGASTMFAVGENNMILKSTDNGLNWENKYAVEPHGKFYYDVCFTSSENGFIVGANETLLKTTDGGNTWDEKKYSPTGILKALSFPSGEVGYTVGSSIFKTIDAGETWTQIPNFSNYLIYLKVDFCNENEGYVLDVHNLTKTNNGGVSWQPVLTTTTSSYSAMSCTDPNTIYVGSTEGHVMKSSDGGISWNYIFDKAGESVMSMNFINNSTGWVSCKNFILRTYNGGSDWDTLYTGFGSGGAIAFSSDGHGCMVDGRRMLRTENGGSIWQLITKGDTQTYTANFKDLCFVNSETGFVVNSDAGCILKTTDGGAHWNSQNTIPGADYSAIHFINGTTGIAVGKHGLIVRTTDGGLTWNIMPSNTTKDIYDLSFGNVSTGYASGDGILLKTTDAGVTWINCFADPYYTSKIFTAVDFVSTDTGFICTENITFRTTDGGLTFNWCNNQGGNSIFFLNSLTGFLVPEASGKLFKTVNGGESWTTISISSWDLNTIWFISPEIGFVAGDKIYKTIDGGETWNAFTVGVWNDFNKIFFVNSSVGYLLNEANEILKTTDCGKSWFFVKGGTCDLYDVFFVDPNHGYATGSHHITKVTEDGGNTWKSYYNESFELGHSLFFTSPSTGYILENKFIFKTEDGGKTWQFIFMSGQGRLSGLYFIDENIGFTVGEYGFMAKTTDHGLSWTQINTGTTEHLSSISFSDDLNGIAVGAKGTILRTTNSGITWQFVANAYNINFSQVQLIDIQNGYLIGRSTDSEKGFLLKTIDSGLTWSKIQEYAIYWFSDIHFVDSITGYLILGDSFEKVVYKTENSGTTLKLLYPINPAGDDRCRSLYFGDHDNGCVVGFENTILKISNGGVYTEVVESGQSIDLSNFIVYPNPATSNITVSRIKNRPGNAWIQIFTLQGQSVTANLLMSKSEKVINVNALPKGVYIVRIQAQNGIETKKIVIR